MNGRPLTRRRFVAGCAGAGALAACGGLAASQAFAEGGDIGVNARPQWDTAHTICRACPNACGYTAYTVDGVLGKTLGDATNPNSAGNLCARGYGYTQSLYSEARVKNPLRRKPGGGFKTISWDEAFSEIGQKLDELVGSEGPESLALIYNGTSADATTYSNLLMEAIGSGNVYVDDVTYDTVRATAYEGTLGVSEYYADIDNANLVLMVDMSFTDVTSPNLVAALQDARAKGTTIAAVDPRMGTLDTFANEWFPVNPGTELALLLAVCNYLISNGRYNKAYVEANVAGFGEWADAIAEYTPIWAEDVCGVDSFRIEQLASWLYEAAPKVAILYGNGKIAGTAYANSGQTARVVCLLNALLGAYGQKGGALLPYAYADDTTATAATTKSRASELEGDAASALAASIVDAGIGQAAQAGAAEALELCGKHLKALITVDADVAYDYSVLPALEEALEKLELSVCITNEMTETAEAADYVLPLCSYLETPSLPLAIQGPFAAFSVAEQVVEPADGNNSLPLGDIVDGIAEACNLEIVPSEEALAGAQARLASHGVSDTGLALDGVCAVNAADAKRIAKWNTPSGKIQCAINELEALDLDALPIWLPPTEVSNIEEVISDDMNLGQANKLEILFEDGTDLPALKLISGELSVLGNAGYNTPELMDIATKYELDSAWINTAVAELLGVSEGDEIFLYNDQYSSKARAHVTDRIVPTAIFLPTSFGRSSDRQRTAKGIGIDPLQFSAFEMIDGYGALCTQEACVRVASGKEGA